MNIERWGWYSVGVNGLLVSVHGLIALVSGSLAVTAEWIHNIVDLLASVAVLLGLKLAMRQSKVFPYGLYKIENLVAAGLAGMVFLSAYEIARDALLAPRSAMRADPWMFVLLAVTTAVPLVFSHFEGRAGRKVNSPALIADAREYRIHVFTTGLAFLALLADRLELPLDRFAALAIVLVVIKTGWEMLRDAMRVLLDASLDFSTLHRIREVAGGDPAVTEIKWITGRNAGRFRFVEAGLALRIAELDKAAVAIRRIETSVRAAVPHVERVLIHVEPVTSPYTRYAVPLADRTGTISRHFGEASFFAFITLDRDGSGVVEQRIIGNPHSGEETAKGIRVAEWLVDQKVDGLLLKQNIHGKGPEYVFREAGVVIHHTEASTLEEVRFENSRAGSLLSQS